MLIQRLASRALDFLLPPTCLECRTILGQGDGGALCTDCFGRLQPHTGVQCHQCATRVEALFSTPGLACGQCVADPPAFVSAAAPFVYEGPARTAILNLKYHYHLGSANFLARAMAGKMPTGTFVLIPVPLHKKRLRKRGFNQSQELAKRLHALHPPTTTLPFQAVARIKETLPQGRHSARQRARNVAGAFRVQKPEAITGQDVLIIDDVITTGATCRALAKTLKKAGARSVSVLAAARALPKYAG